MRHILLLACMINLCNGCLAGHAPSASASAILSQSNGMGSNSPGTQGNSNSVNATPLNFPQAAHPSLLSVNKGSGSVIASPTVRIVTFNGDAQAMQLEDFATKLAASPYWKMVAGDYGVGNLTVGAPRRETMTWPDVVTDGDSSIGEPSDVEALLISKLDGTSPAWGAPDANTVYTLLFPAGTKVSSSGSPASACSRGILSWHTALVLPSSKVTVHYVVVPDCGALAKLTEINSRTLATSHALVEAVTDPTIDAYGQLDANHLVWQIVSGNPEVASACDVQQDNGANLVADANAAGLTYAVQRSWSNAAAAVGRSPCVPAAPGEVYVDAVPVITGTVKTLTSPYSSALPVSTAGVNLTPGQTATVALDLISDGPTPNPWQVTATEVGTTDLTLQLDKAQGKNGDVLHLSIGASGTPASPRQIIKITSTLGTFSNNQYILVTP